MSKQIAQSYNRWIILLICWKMDHICGLLHMRNKKRPISTYQKWMWHHQFYWLIINRQIVVLYGNILINDTIRWSAYQTVYDIQKSTNHVFCWYIECMLFRRKEWHKSFVGNIITMLYFSWFYSNGYLDHSSYDRTQFIIENINGYDSLCSNKSTTEFYTWTKIICIVVSVSLSIYCDSDISKKSTFNFIMYYTHWQHRTKWHRYHNNNTIIR